MSKTQVQRSSSLLQDLWSGDETTDPLPDNIRDEIISAMITFHPQFWPDDTEYDVDDPCQEPEGLTNNQRAGIFLQAMRLYAKNMRSSWRISCAEHQAKKEEEADMDTDPEAPPIDEE